MRQTSAGLSILSKKKELMNEKAQFLAFQTELDCYIMI